MKFFRCALNCALKDRTKYMGQSVATEAINDVISNYRRRWCEEWQATDYQKQLPNTYLGEDETRENEFSEEGDR